MNPLSLETAKEMLLRGLINKQSYNNILLIMRGVSMEDIIPLTNQAEPNSATPGRKPSAETEAIRSLDAGESCAVYVGNRDMASVRTSVYTRAKSAGIKVSAVYDANRHAFLVTRIA